MNKKDIADIRKQFKMDDSLLKIKEIYSVYLKKDNKEIIFADGGYFDKYDTEEQELFLANFKKLLSGNLGSKLFELDFKEVDNRGNAQSILNNSLTCDMDSFKDYVNDMVQKISDNVNYDNDVVITFVKAEYFKPTKSKGNEEDAGADDTSFGFEFLMCSVNKVDSPKKAMKFDYNEKEFKANSVLDVIINLTSPLDGFMFPTFSNNCSDASKVLYYSPKSEQMNRELIEQVLECDVVLTAKEEKSIFNTLLLGVIGEKVSPEMISVIYEKINEETEDYEGDEAPTLDLRDVKRILKQSGVEDVDKLDSVLNDITGESNHEFKINNIMPNYNSKSIKLDTENTTITLSPKDLKNVKQIINSNGQKCLIIEISEDVILDGFVFKTEKY